MTCHLIFPPLLPVFCTHNASMKRILCTVALALIDIAWMFAYRMLYYVKPPLPAHRNITFILLSVEPGPEPLRYRQKCFLRHREREFIIID